MDREQRIEVFTSENLPTGYSFHEGELKSDAPSFSDVSRGYRVETQPSGTSSPEMPIQKLYSSKVAQGQELENAIRLLTEASQFAQEAVEAIREKDIFKSDDSMQKLNALLPELFCCRELGDGFGMIVNALYHCYKNLNGDPLKEDQILEIKSLLNKLSEAPFLSTDEAVEEVIRLEEVGLFVEPKGLHVLTEVLDE